MFNGATLVLEGLNPLTPPNKLVPFPSPVPSGPQRQQDRGCIPCTAPPTPLLCCSPKPAEQAPSATGSCAQWSRGQSSKGGGGERCSSDLSPGIWNRAGSWDKVGGLQPTPHPWKGQRCPLQASLRGELAEAQTSQGWDLGLPGFTLATNIFWPGCGTEHGDLAPRIPNCPTAHLKLSLRDSLLGPSC